MVLTNGFKIIIALLGFHVFRNTVSLDLGIRQETSCKCELNNKLDKFAVCGSAILPGKIAPVAIGHASKKPSRYIWFTSQKGPKVSAVGDNTKPYRSPLLL